MTGALLDIEDLRVTFTGRGRGPEVRAVDGVTYSVYAGQTLAIVGESGSGKTVSCRAVMGLLPPGAVVTGSARFQGTQLIGLSDDQLRQHRGANVAMVFQDPARSLNPTMRVGAQIAEAVRAHRDVTKVQAKEQAVDLLRQVHIPLPERRCAEYPHQLSGGMRQRVMIAIALACRPRLLIADEATTALDVTTQAQIMELLLELQADLGMALMLISHDLGLAGAYADEVIVMYAGRIVEQAPAIELATRVRMPYTQALYEAIPRLERPAHAPLPVIGGRAARPGHAAAGLRVRAALPPGRRRLPGRRAAAGRARARPPLGLLASRQRRPELTEAPLLQVKDLVHEFRTDLGTVHAVSGVSFDVRAGETLGIVGETGSGKSTLARSIVQAPRPTSGAVVFRGADLVTLRGASLLRARRHLQMVFQDPFGSLDPKWRVRDLVEEPLIAYKTGDRTARRRRVDEVLELVGLAGHSTRRPRELSGGQAQRVAIARAVALNPALIICDEAVSSLDVLIQAQVLNLFERLRAELGLSYLFIAHDLALVKQVSDRVAVMYLGKLCEVGPGEEVYRQPLHPYTRALLDSVPDTATARKTRTIRGAIQGEPPSPVHPPSGCRFRTRCPRAEQRCADEEPAVRELPTGHTAGHSVACHFPLVPADTSVRSEEKIGETPR